MEQRITSEQQSFIDQFKEEYYSAIADEYGTADITPKEILTLRELYIQTKQNLFGDTPLSSLSKVDRECVRSLVISRIVEEGWPAPREVGAKEAAETAIAHACGVAEYLIRQRGIEASPNTYFSYTTKNQFDRFVYMILVKSGRMKAGSRLLREWHSPQNRVFGHENQAMKYPDDVDFSKIHGVAKPHRYWPAQLLRVMEEIKLEKMSKERKADLGIEESTDVKRYSIPWQNFKEAIENASSVDEIAINIAMRTMEILHSRGLNDNQITELIIDGYSPRGPISEHGNIPQVHELWGKIIDSVKESEQIKHLAEELQEKVAERIKSTGYSFNYTPSIR